MHASLTVTESGNYVRITGGIRFENALRILGELKQYYFGDTISIDLSGVTTVDATGLQALHRFRTDARRQGKAVRFHSASPPCIACFRMLGVEKLFGETSTAGEPLYHGSR